MYKQMVADLCTVKMGRTLTYGLHTMKSSIDAVPRTTRSHFIEHKKGICVTIYDWESSIKDYHRPWLQMADELHVSVSDWNCNNPAMEGSFRRSSDGM